MSTIHIHRRGIGAALLLCAAVAACGASTRSRDQSPRTGLPQRLDPGLERVDSAVGALLRQREIPGAAVAILRGDTLVFARGYGVADRERNLPVRPGTLFQLASTTKPFTAMAVLMLAEEGRVDLDAPAARYLPWLPAKYDGVTPRQLLTHTGGVYPDVRRANVDEMTVEEFRRRLEEQPVSFAPGTRWQYANAGYTLLADIVERVSGEELGAFLRRRIFQPLGMRTAGYRVAATGDTLHAVGYDRVEGRLERAPHVFSGWGNSGMEASVLDLAAWAAALERQELLAPRSYQAMYAPARLASGAEARFEFGGAPQSGYGLGWFLSSYRGEPLITHGGAIAGFSSIVNRFPGRRLTIIVLSNGKQGEDRMGQADALARAIAAELL
ncbi:MAG TPA: serine hydrolase domain-containing protein [Longimicrobium sp.]|nr:serine hydrolase domain-containing protein [Longimicrobium sp.]